MDDNDYVLHLKTSVRKIRSKPAGQAAIPALIARYIGIRGGLYTITPAISTPLPLRPHRLKRIRRAGGYGAAATPELRLAGPGQALNEGRQGLTYFSRRILLNVMEAGDSDLLLIGPTAAELTGPGGDESAGIGIDE